LFGLFLRQNARGEGKKKPIELLQRIETDAKKTKRPDTHLVDYTIIKKELGLL
jgi:hypothetical protein